jgi:hypothetical protein
MKKFIVIYHAPQSAMEGMKDASPADMKKGMEPWMAWAKKCGQGLIDLGTPLGNAHKVSKDHHGPSKSDVVGYSILQAETWEELRNMIEGHPHLSWGSGCEIEVHESLPLPM